MRPKPDTILRRGTRRVIVLITLIALAAAPTANALDRTGKVRQGVASYYGPGFAGKKTASGERMKPNHMTAASRTLPLGARAKVTNRETGKSVEVTVTDRGPYAKGRIIDVSPRAAELLDMKHDGVIPVKVEPVELPPENTRN